MKRTRHGLYKDINGKKTRLYHIWEDMKARCNNKNLNRYESYGGRGIKVCADWENYKNFHDWAMANDYKENLTIDRKNVNGSYEPSNCKFSTSKEQGNNRRNSRIIEFNNESNTVSEWCDKYNLKYHVLKNRLNRGWGIEKAITTKVSKTRKYAT